MLGELVNAGSTFEDTPLTASDFQFSNALFTVDPETGLPPVPVPVTTSSASAATGGFLGGGGLLFVAAAAVAIYFYWPQIRAEVSKYVG